jgi:hypothetical protein
MMICRAKPPFVGRVAVQFENLCLFVIDPDGDVIVGHCGAPVPGILRRGRGGMLTWVNARRDRRHPSPI